MLSCMHPRGFLMPCRANAFTLRVHGHCAVCELQHQLIYAEYIDMRWQQVLEMSG